MNTDLYLEAAAALMLLPCVFTDIRRRTVSCRYLLALLAGGACLRTAMLVQHRCGLWQTAFSLLPGGAMLIFSRLTGRQIGEGDGACVLAVGLVGGAWIASAGTLLGLFFSGALCAVLFVCRRVSLQSRVAFVPCLFAGTAAGTLLHWYGL